MLTYFPLLAIAALLAIAVGMAYLSGWSTLADSWGYSRLRSPKGAVAYFAQIDWAWSYRWCIRVRIIERGVHCQPISLFLPLYFHRPLLIPWSDIHEVRDFSSWGEAAIEVRATSAGYDFCVSFPASVGFPADKRPNKALQPTTTAGTSAAKLPRVPAAVVADL
jgi:hypothetical protein